MENEKHVSHFPTHGFVFVSKTQKGGLAADRFAPAPGSFFDEKMLRPPLRGLDAFLTPRDCFLDVTLMTVFVT